MFLFSLPVGLQGGSKETAYQTSASTSHSTSRGTNKSTSKTTNKGTWRSTYRYTSKTTTYNTSNPTSHISNWLTNYQTDYNTQYDTTHSTQNDTTITTSNNTQSTWQTDAGWRTYWKTDMSTLYSTINYRLVWSAWRNAYSGYGHVTYKSTCPNTFKIQINTATDWGKDADGRLSCRFLNFLNASGIDPSSVTLTALDDDFAPNARIYEYQYGVNYGALLDGTGYIHPRIKSATKFRVEDRSISQAYFEWLANNFSAPYQWCDIYEYRVHGNIESSETTLDPSIISDIENFFANKPTWDNTIVGTYGFMWQPFRSSNKPIVSSVPAGSTKSQWIESLGTAIVNCHTNDTKWDEKYVYIPKQYQNPTVAVHAQGRSGGEPGLYMIHAPMYDWGVASSSNYLGGKIESYDPSVGFNCYTNEKPAVTVTLPTNYAQNVVVEDLLIVNPWPSGGSEADSPFILSFKMPIGQKLKVTNFYPIKEGRTNYYSVLTNATVSKMTVVMQDTTSSWSTNFDTTITTTYSTTYSTTHSTTHSTSHTTTLPTNYNTINPTSHTTSWNSWWTTNFTSYWTSSWTTSWTSHWTTTYNSFFTTSHITYG